MDRSVISGNFFNAPSFRSGLFSAATAIGKQTNGDPHADRWAARQARINGRSAVSDTQQPVRLSPTDTEQIKNCGVLHRSQTEPRTLGDQIYVYRCSGVSCFSSPKFARAQD
jgi:hypothetical protein